ncbi:MAG TPA: YdeI/OmpD-associated family protein [Lacunisphaera sp.]|nr:YdeI/OmpD-associated family protein [Lacunisphaera sp.]
MFKDKRIDAYIAKSAPFAQPILQHLRQLVHQACPETEEALKWSSPFFLYRGRILCFMAAFKAHLAFGFWGPAMKRIITRDGHAKDGRGLMGRITSRQDLPGDKVLTHYIKTAVKLHDSGLPARPKPKPKSALPMPADLAAALKKNKKAAVAWADFSPSARREYIEWITEAKRDETRASRLATTLQWVAAGKPRNWKYMNC